MKINKVGTVTLDINEYDRLNDLERNLDLTKKVYADSNTLMVKSLIGIIQNLSNENQLVLSRAATDAGYSWQHTTPEGSLVKLGEGSQIIKLNLK